MDVVSKVLGDSYSSAEFNQSNNELENAITNAGITLSAADLFQLSKSISNYASSGDFYTDSGVADAYVLSVIGTKQSPTAYTDGMRVRFIPGVVNTGASTINVNSLGVKSIKNPSGGVLLAGDISINGVTLQYDSGNGWFIVYDVASGGSTFSVFTESFTSTGQTITAAGSLTLAHGLSSSPDLIQARLKCTTANFGYSIGDELIINNSLNTDGTVPPDNGHSLVVDATNINVRYGSSATTYQILDKTSGAAVNAANTSWQLIIKAWA